MARKAPEPTPVPTPAPRAARAVRRCAAALAALVVTGLAAAPSASAAPAAISGAGSRVLAAGEASPSRAPELPEGLFGDADPKYDGVWRQSYALLAEHTAGRRPAASAVDWLLGQQCADGSFPAYRAEPAKACGKAAPGDTNMTAAAVQALAALGDHDGAVQHGVRWLRAHQNKDGGFGAAAGGPTDANTVSVVLGALVAAGQDPAKVTAGGHTPYQALAALQVGCKAAAADRGAFAYQAKDGELAPNASASTAAVLAAEGRGLTVPAAKKGTDEPVHAPSCTDEDEPAGKADGGRAAASRAADAGAAYLVRTLAAHGQRMPGLTPKADPGNTAAAVLALAAGGHTTAARKPLPRLEHDGVAWARTAGPAAWAQLVLAAHAVGADPHHFGGQDLVKQLDATGPASTAPHASASPAAKSSGGGGVNVWWIIGVGLAVGAGIGFLISGRNKGPRL
ncbi:prenyltransferase/squalene oxidase repeat-containing protein [Streptomyces sp. NPDC059740]|uniref:prenyltransferase/squalene oxidase repeat-containing protein n=1 Tax=Streptomyces sp. NPDC059740 TaxID=3346926 RepID=UPI003654CE58